MNAESLIFTFLGLAIGGVIGWLIENKPYLFSASVPKKQHRDKSLMQIRSLMFSLLSGIIFWALANSDYTAQETARDGFLITVLAGIAIYDFKYYLIPNRLILVGIFGWFFSLTLWPESVIPALAGGFSASFFVLIIRWLGHLFYRKAGMGMGDVKLVFLLGLFLQWNVFWVLYLAVFAGGLYAAVGISFRLLERSGRLPFAPFLVIGVILAGFLIPYSKFLGIWG